MEFQNLRAFVAVAETGSFSSAGEQLFLTQPAISKRVSALEEELGRRLFDRIGRQVLLTEAGQTLLPHARRVLDDIEDSRRAIQNLAGRVDGTLSFGTSHHIGLHRLPPVLSAFNIAHPQVTLDIHFRDSETLCQQVVAGQLEFAVVTLPPNPTAQMATETIWDDPLLLVTGRQHPLGQATAPVALAELANHRAILPGAGTYTRRIVDEAFTRDGVPLTVAMSTNNLETIKMLVSINLGWSILPATMSDATLSVSSIKGLAMRRNLGLITHRDRTPSNAARVFIDTLRASSGAAALAT